MSTFLDERKKIDPQPIGSSLSITELIDSTFLAYNAGRIREACALFDMRYAQEEVLVGMSITGALTPAGMGITCFAPLMQAGLVDWIVSTGANLYHDLHFSLAKSLYQGSPYYDDTALKREGVVRIYDIVFDYSVLLKTDEFVRTVCAGEEFNRTMGTAELHWLLGKYAAEREKQLGLSCKSLLSTAYEYDIPVYSSSPGDSSIGMNIAALTLQGKGPCIDVSQDVNETAAFVYAAKKQQGKSAVCIIGGGSPKNFILQTEPHIQEVLGLEEAGHDYFIQITDARPDTGGLSGATPSEAVSWGKIDPAGLPDTVVVYADTTIVLPLLAAYVLANNRSRSHKRLYQKRRECVEEMKLSLND